MLWVKLMSKTFILNSFNLHIKEDGTPQLWVTRADGVGQVAVEGMVAYEYRDMLEHAVKTGERYVELG